MKKVLTLLIGLSFSLSITAGTAYQSNVEIDDIFIPLGFDTNDKTQILVTGYLPNLCHKKPIVTTRINGFIINIDVESLFYEGNTFCPEAVKKFTKVIDLGKLQHGEYQIIFNGNSRFEEKRNLLIEEARLNYLDKIEYPYVTEIKVEKNELSNEKILTVKGYKDSHCMKEGEIQFLDNGKNTFTVLPKLRQIDDFCPKKLIPISYETTIPQNLNTDEVLLHVKSEQNEGVNQIINLD